MSGSLSLIGIFVFLFGLLCLLLLPLWRGSDFLQKRIFVALLLLTPLLAYVSYGRLGAYADLQIRDEYQGMLGIAAAGQEIPPDEWDALLLQINQRAEKTDKAEYWYLLAGLYEDMQQFELASDNYEKAAEVYSEDASILARWAETEFVAQGYNLTPKVQQISERTLALDPSNVTVLGILGISSFQDGQTHEAIGFWTRALQALPPNSENARVIQASILLAQQELAETGGASPDVSQTQAEDARNGIPLSISLVPGVQVDPDNTVFVIARISGSPMPTAVTRLRVADLPAQISLDDSMVMIPGTNLMNLPLLEVVARISFSGQPIAESGDYEVVVSGISPSEIEGPIELVLAEQIQ